MTEIKIGGRTIPLLYTTCELIAIQREIGCTGFELNEKVFAIERPEDDDNPENIRIRCAEDPERLEGLCKLIRILGNAGLEEKGEEPDLTDRWVMRNMKPVTITAYAIAVMYEISNGNRMESPATEKTEGPVDEGLEEMNGKKQPGN
jgi:hypothetical protein